MKQIQFTACGNMCEKDFSDNLNFSDNVNKKV